MSTNRKTSLANLLHSLNPEQRKAATHGEGPLLILAGAGSGKTKTMSTRMAYLVGEKQIPSHQILGLSFTNKAAKELKDRVRGTLKKYFPDQNSNGILMTTFHSLCVRVLRQYGHHLGFKPDFTIVDSGDQTDILKNILKNFKLDDRKFDLNVLLFHFGQAKNKLLSTDQITETLLESNARVMPSDYAIAAASSFEKYQTQLKVQNAMDFDDLIKFTVQLLQDNESVRKACNERFRYILVDEYQDTNPAQFKILKLLTEKSQNLCVVGDDDQSIYSWRGADPEQILSFNKHFPGAELVTLNQNYRSTTTILKAANQVISKNTKRHSKELWSKKGEGVRIQQILVNQDREEAEAVADHIHRMAHDNFEGIAKQVRPWKDFAILYRSNAQSRLFEEALRRYKVPYKMVGGLSFLERKEIKDVLSYWRLILNPNDEASARRIINWPPRGIGRTSLEAIHQRSIELQQNYLDVIPLADLKGKSQISAQSFLALIEALRRSLDQTPCEPESLSNWAKNTLRTIGVKAALDEECEDPVQVERRWENLDELCNGLGQLNIYEWPEEHRTARHALSEYLSQLTLEDLDEQDKEKNENRDEITLLTLHSSKGLEFPVVFMVGMEEGFLPHRRTLEEGTDLSEERRLCYVGITRAQEKLFFTRARSRIRYGKPVPRIPSRYIDDISPDLIETRDESAIPDLSTPEAQEQHEVRVKSFLDQIRQNLLSPKN